MTLLKWMMAIVIVQGVALAKSSKAMIEDFDQAFYYPQQRGLEDLIVDISIDGFAEKLSDDKLLGNIEELLFRVYWLKDGRKNLEIIGLGAGLEKIKSKLSLNALEYFDLVIPPSLQQKLRGYSVKKRNDGYFAKDSTGKKAVNEMFLWVDANAQVSRISYSSSGSFVQTNFDYTTRDFIKGKLLLKSIKREVSYGDVKIFEKKDLDYEQKQGFALVKRMVVNRTLKDGQNERKSKDVVKFTNFQINTGKAQKWFLKEAQE